MNFCKDCKWCYQETDTMSMIDARYKNHNPCLCTNEKLINFFNPVTGTPPKCRIIRAMVHPIFGYGHGRCTVFEPK